MILGGEPCRSCFGAESRVLSSAHATFQQALGALGQQLARGHTPRLCAAGAGVFKVCYELEQSDSSCEP